MVRGGGRLSGHLRLRLVRVHLVADLLVLCRRLELLSSEQHVIGDVRLSVLRRLGGG